MKSSCEKALSGVVDFNPAQRDMERNSTDFNYWMLPVLHPTHIVRSFTRQTDATHASLTTLFLVALTLLTPESFRCENKATHNMRWVTHAASLSRSLLAGRTAELGL